MRRINPGWWILALALLPAMAGAATLEVGPQRHYTLPSQAITVARSGDQIVIDAGTYTDCAVVAQNNLVIAGAPGATVVLRGKTCEDQGILVIVGANITIRNLTLADAHSVHFNGAGIRQFGPSLVVDEVHFEDNENGILATPATGGVLLVRNSEFLRNGSCEQACAHAIYAGTAMTRLVVERSRFVGTRRGHHIKSRALSTDVVECSLADGEEGTASYHIDIPNGGDVLIRDNWMRKGPNAENRTAAIMLGAEGVERPTNSIVIENNRLDVMGAYSSVFVFNHTATPAELRRNHLGARVEPLRGPGSVIP